MNAQTGNQCLVHGFEHPSAVPREQLRVFCELEECYGKVWSAPEPKPDNLEWGFLMWLSRQK
jgi:hypothetical protein